MKTAEQLSNVLTLTTDALEDAISEAHEAEAIHQTAQNDLAEARMNAILSHEPADLGKNEQQRDARLMEITTAERTTLKLTEARRHEAQTRVAICKLRQQQTMAEIKLLELTKPSPELVPLRMG